MRVRFQIRRTGEPPAYENVDGLTVLPGVGDTVYWRSADPEDEDGEPFIVRRVIHDYAHNELEVVLHQP